MYAPQPGWMRFARQLLVSVAGMIAAVLALLWLWPDWSVWHWSGRAWRLALLVGAGALAYLLLLWLQGLRPRDLRH